MRKMIIGITTGDPAGIGPEIVVKVLNSRLNREADLIVISDRAVIEKAMDICDGHMPIHPVHPAAQLDHWPDCFNLIDLGTPGAGGLGHGKVQGLAGKAAYAYIRKATQQALAGSLDAIATGPVNKMALQEAGVEQIGHTEILAALTNTHDPLTMFQVDGLRVFFLSRHVSLSDACRLVTKPRLLETIGRSVAALQRIGIEDPVLAVAGLNPHGGENGRFGMEEITEIIPAVAAARAAGYRVAGPIPADAVFHMALQGTYDAVLALYHDQGHIAAKMVDFHRTVSITHGLPFLRTSVDHGTAYDIAGKGTASAVSMAEAVRAAIQYAPAFLRCSERG